jgi:hypothetical protein
MLSSPEEDTKLLAAAALEERFPAEWDDSYISALNRALGWNALPAHVSASG